MIAPHILRASLLTAFAFLAACGESDGPSLLPAGEGAGPPAGFLAFANGQAAYTVIGQPDFVSSFSLTTQSGLDVPGAGVVGGGGTLWVVDQFNSRVLGFNSIPTAPGPNADIVIGQAAFVTSNTGFASDQLDSPASVADNGTQLFIADINNSRIQVFNSIPTTSHPSADFSIGAPDPNSPGLYACTQNTMRGPRDIYATASHLFVADNVCNRVTIYNLPITANQPNAAFVLGQSTFTGSTPGLSATQLSDPFGVWSDDTRILVADLDNNRVLVFNSFPTSNGASADLVLGQADFTSNVFGTNNHNFESGSASGVTANGTQIFVADYYNNRVMIWNAWPTGNGVPANRVLGQPDFTSNASNVTATGLNGPNSVSLSGQYLLVADQASNRVMIWRTQ
ncbi:MAG: hypothetical protein HY281_00895 [Nitrospirae bacterium]|nr:hypothetical protein [Nitrospirota bacterium]